MTAQHGAEGGMLGEAEKKSQSPGDGTIRNSLVSPRLAVPKPLRVAEPGSPSSAAFALDGVEERRHSQCHDPAGCITFLASFPPNPDEIELST